ncbi:unnamed protein product [Thelazia callipaeda]|uniref:Delta-like protein n=1 Tax=Thelazia callipaeda TaxID=103827 RepID=A0A0N5D4W0_THECL|nr:unnamed protein product [Thelazia callipaeda]
MKFIGWSLYGTSCYIAVLEELSWTEANDLCASQKYNYSQSIALSDWLLMRDMSITLLNSKGNYWTAFYHTSWKPLQQEECNSLNAVLNKKYQFSTASIYNPLWSFYQPAVDYCTRNSCVYMSANFSDQINYGWKMEDCNIAYFTICETFACLKDYEYRCEDNSNCYPHEGQCDGIQDCSDNSDEENCSVKHITCGKPLYEETQNEIIFEINSTEYVICQWTIRSSLKNKIILRQDYAIIGDTDELVIDGIQNTSNSVHEYSYGQSKIMSMKTLFVSINNTVTIIYRSFKSNGVAMKKLKFTYTTQETYCFLPVIPYGTVLNVTGFETGNILWFKCNLGYHTPSGEFATSRCHYNEWIPKPECQILSCGPATVVYNKGILSGYTRNFTLYSRALYSCEPGFYLNGTSPPFRLCIQNGSWTNPDFFCQAPHCYATSFPFGHFIHQSYPNGTAGKYICDDGFEQIDNDPICVFGIWNQIPNCQPKYYCTDNPCKNGTCVQFSGGYSCLCNEGFQMLATSTGYTCTDIDECLTPGYSFCEFTCINTIGSYECRCPITHRLYTGSEDMRGRIINEKFLIPNKSCIEKRCSVPEIPSNVIPYPFYVDFFSYENGLYFIHTIIYFACLNSTFNYTSMICDKTETWVLVGSCTNITCSAPQIARKNLIFWPVKKTYNFKDEIHFSCNEPYYLDGPSSSHCIGANVWSLPKLPDCIKHITSDKQKWCSNSNPCDNEDLCRNDGICSVWNNKPRCICKIPYYGEYCTEMANPCKDLPCTHGTCTSHFDQLWPYYFCECDLGYYGEKCTTRATCANNFITCKYGYCQQGSHNEDAFCKCYTGFTGSDCSQIVNECSSSPCVHGTCQMRFQGKVGSSESKIAIDPCDEKPCGMNSECHALSYGYHGRYICICTAGWTGERCTELLDICVDAQCAEGSTCITVSGTQGDVWYLCICPSNKEGIFCNKSIDYCISPNPCLNNGVCESLDDGYLCHCNLGYYGDHCQYHPCFPNPCHNNGTCTESEISGYKCICPQYYTGINCTEVEDICATNYFKNYCLNGGQCISNNSEPTCVCIYQFEGRRCEKIFNNQTSKLTSISFDAKVLKQFTLCFWIRIMDLNKLDASFLHLQQKGYGKNILAITENAIKFGKNFEFITVTENEWQQFCFRKNKDETIDWIRNGKIIWTKNWSASFSNNTLRIVLGASTLFSGELSMVQSDRNVVFANLNNKLNGKYSNEWIEELIIRGTKIVKAKKDHFYDNKVAPQVVNCPSSMNIVSKNRLTTVEWSPAKSSEVFTDNGIVNITSNYDSGDIFTWGEHHVVYIAEDEDGNIATCQFDVVITPKNCAVPEKSDGRKIIIQDVNSEKAQKIAFIECLPNYMPVRPTAAFYTCDLLGQWSYWSHGINFYFPACLEYTFPLQQLSGLVTVKGSSNDVEKYIKNLTDAILKANEQFGNFCATPNCTDELKIWPVLDLRYWMSKYISEPLYDIFLYYSITVNTTRKAIEPVVTTNLYQVFGKSNEKSNTTWQCPFENYPAQIIQDDSYSCVKCSPGMFCEDNSCKPCPENTYKKNDGCEECIPCPNNTVTGPINDDVGYQSIYDCYTNCSPGYYYNVEKEECTECLKGMYQDKPGRLQCIPCPESYSTPNKGSACASDCSVTCGAGMSMNTQSECVECAQGKYRPENSIESRCTPCPNFFTTPHNGSISSTDCTVPNCPPGTYINSISPSGCLSCPKNYYQSNYNQTECQRCEEPLVTLVTGSTHPRQCVKPTIYDSSASTVDINENLSATLWPILGFASLIGIVAFLTALYFERQRISTLFCTTRGTRLKHMATRNYYRHSFFIYPIVTTARSVDDWHNNSLENRVPNNTERQVFGIRGSVFSADSTHREEFSQHILAETGYEQYAQHVDGINERLTEMNSSQQSYIIRNWEFKIFPKAICEESTAYQPSLPKENYVPTYKTTQIPYMDNVDEDSDDEVSSI